MRFLAEFIRGTAAYFGHILSTWPKYVMDGVLPGLVILVIFGWQAALAFVLVLPFLLHIHEALVQRAIPLGIEMYEYKQVKAQEDEIAARMGCPCPQCRERRGEDPNVAPVYPTNEDLQRMIDGILGGEPN